MTVHQSPQSNCLYRISFAIAVGLGISFCYARALWPSPQAELARATGQALAAHQFERAEALARMHLATAPQNTFACLIGAEASRQNYDYVGAATYVSKLAQCDDGRTEEVAYCRGVHAQQQGRVAEAEELFRETLRRNPAHLDANRRLTYLLQLQGRLWESIEFILPVLQSGVFLADELLIAGNSGRAYIDDEEYRETCLAAVPSDRRLLVNSIRQLVMDNHVTAARQQLNEVLKSAPNFVEALIYDGHLLLREDATEGWTAWNQKLPNEAKQHPEVWYVRGLWAKQQRQTSGAVRCFLETVRREPNHSGAVFQLSQLLAQQGQQAAAKFYAERSTILSKLDYFISELRNTPDLEMMRQTVELLSSSQRYWEAIGWCRVALMRQANLNWAKAGLARLRPLVAQSQRLVMTASFPKELSPENFPLPNWDHSQKTPPILSAELVDCRVRFEDVAAVSGLTFQYFNGTTPSTGLEHMLQSTGGGVAVIDYDVDGWPDLYFAQSGVWPLQPGHGVVDQLFRNTGDNRFEKVTTSSALGDDRYSQGVTVGDFNNDGFPDLYVCNVGENRFYENQGDGTFRDITQQTGTAFPVTEQRTCCNCCGVPNNLGVVAWNGMLAANVSRSASDCKDGLSNTIIVGEFSNFVKDTAGVDQRINSEHGWLMGNPGGGVGGGSNRTFNTTTINYPPNSVKVYPGNNGVHNNDGPNNGLVSAHSGSIHAAMADGTVRTINNSVDMLTLRRLCARRDGQVIGEY